MPPFAQLRIWLREGPAAEKTLAGAAILIALALVGLALVPVYNGSGGLVAAAGGSASAGSAAGGSASAGSNGSSVATGAAAGSRGSTNAAAGVASGGVSGTAGPVSGAASTGGSAGTVTSGAGTVTSLAGGSTGSGRTIGQTTSSACSGMIASGQGVTASQVHVDMAEVDLAGPVGNAAFGIRSDTPSIVNAVVDYINKSGGVACGRKLVVTQYKVNPVDPNDGQSKCLQMVADNVLAVINAAGYVTPVSEECFVQNHLPLETATSIGRQQGASSYPYLFSPLDSSEQEVRDAILGLAARGFFKAPMFSGRLGLFEDSCLPSANAEISKDLAASGVGTNQTSTYVLDCDLVAPPNQIEQAVLQNKVAGDTQVFLGTTISNNQNYIRIADQQNFHPQYLTSDYGSNEAPGQTWNAGFDGAVEITSTRAGELDSGIHTPAEVTCNSILVSHGIKPLTNGASDVGATGACDLLFMLALAIDHAGVNPSRIRVVEALGSMGYFHSAYYGDGLWNTPGQLTGGDFQREIRYHTSCQCWKVVDPSFGPAY